MEDITLPTVAVKANPADKRMKEHCQTLFYKGHQRDSRAQSLSQLPSDHTTKDVTGPWNLEAV